MNKDIFTGALINKKKIDPGNISRIIKKEKNTSIDSNKMNKAK